MTTFNVVFSEASCIIFNGYTYIVYFETTKQDVCTICNSFTTTCSSYTLDNFLATDIVLLK